MVDSSWIAVRRMLLVMLLVPAMVVRVRNRKAVVGAVVRAFAVGTR